MNSRLPLLLFTTLALAALLGCQSDDGPTGPGQTDPASTGLVQGEIADGTVAFEFASVMAAGDDGARPGRFLIRGHDVHYDPELAALVVDLTVVNAGDQVFPEPVTLTFVSLVPDSVRILNADNGETGPGALFACEFANDDGMWTPGEESFPFTVQFAVDQGVSIGFAARVDVGLLPGGGTIGGVVWHDLDEDGVIDPDEAGLADVAVSLHGGPDEHWLTTTGADGTYRFDGLAPGYFTVTRLPRDDLRATTPPQLHVLLVTDENGDVMDFLAANFGCLVLESPPEGDIQVGDCLHAKGDFTDDPARLLVDHACTCSDDDDDPESDCWERISGPITAVDLEEHTVAVMGATLHLTAGSDIDLDPSELVVGRRVRVEVAVTDGEDGPRLEICRLRSFEGHWDRVRGFVQRVELDDDGHATRVQILGVHVDLTQAGDCDGDDDS